MVAVEGTLRRSGGDHPESSSSERSAAARQTVRQGQSGRREVGGENMGNVHLSKVTHPKFNHFYKLVGYNKIKL